MQTTGARTISGPVPDTLASDTPTASIHVPRRYSLERANARELTVLLRERLLVVCALVAGTTAFFGAYRILRPASGSSSPRRQRARR